MYINIFIYIIDIVCSHFAQVVPEEAAVAVKKESRFGWCNSSAEQGAREAQEEEEEEGVSEAQGMGTRA